MCSSNIFARATAPPNNCLKRLPSSFSSRFQSESWCSTMQTGNLSFVFSCRSNSFSFEWLSTRTRFETEANSNSEMAYCSRCHSDIIISIGSLSKHDHDDNKNLGNLHLYQMNEKQHLFRLCTCISHFFLHSAVVLVLSTT